MFKNLLKRLKSFKSLTSDRGDSLVSLILVTPLIIGILISGIDFSIYMANRGVIQGVVRDGARTVAIMGGNGTATTGTPIEVKYGYTRTTACAGIVSGSAAGSALKSTSTPIECNIMRGINASAGLVNVTVSSVTCTPSITSAIGQQVSCTIVWTYGGIPWSAMSFFKDAASEQNTTSASSESEVNLSGVRLVSRGS